MENFIKLILLLTFTNSSSQVIVNNSTFNQGPTEGKYFKDLDNNIPAFEGIWQNTTGNITFRIILFKETKKPFGYPVEYFMDNMGGSFQIIQDLGTSNEMVLHNSIKFYPGSTHSETSVFFADADATGLGGWMRDNCASVGSGSLVAFFELNKITPTTAHWNVKPGAIRFSGQYFSIPTDVIMTKIN